MDLAASPISLVFHVLPGGQSGPSHSGIIADANAGNARRLSGIGALRLSLAGYTSVVDDWATDALGGTLGHSGGNSGQRVGARHAIKMIHDVLTPRPPLAD